MLHLFICKFHSQASSWRMYEVLHFIECLSPSGVALYTSSSCKGCTALVWVIMHDNCCGYGSAETDRRSHLPQPQDPAPQGWWRWPLLAPSLPEQAAWASWAGGPGSTAGCCEKPSLNQPAALYGAALLQLLATISSACWGVGGNQASIHLGFPQKKTPNNSKENLAWSWN